MKLQKQIAVQKQRREYRVRNRVRASGRLRLSVYRSGKHISVQVIDDATGKTVVSASTYEAAFRTAGKSGGNVAAATEIGKLIAERATAQGIVEVAFDRGAARYHGRIAALADAAREGGLNF